MSQFKSLFLLSFLLLILSLGNGCQQQIDDTLDENDTQITKQALNPKLRKIITPRGDQIPWENFSFIKNPSATPNDQFSYALAVADFNNDNFNDLAVSQPFNNKPVLVYKGTQNKFETTPSWIINPPAKDIYFGTTILTVKNCNTPSNNIGLLISAPGANDQKGEIFLYTFDALTNTFVLNKSWIGINKGDYIGQKMAIADFNGDDKLDLATSAFPENDPTFLLLQSDFCNQTNLNNAIILKSPKPDATTSFGSHITFAKLSKDSKKDTLIVSDELYKAQGETHNAGAIYLFDYNQTTNKFELKHKHFGTNDDKMAPVVSTDLNLDGYNDLIIASPSASITENVQAEGVIRAYINKSGDFDFTKPVWTYNSGLAKAFAGTNLITADINNDNQPDLIIAEIGQRPQGGIRRPARLNLFMGTKNEPYLTTFPFWSYTSEHAALNDATGKTAIIVANVDNQGWPDLIASAPEAKPTTSSPDNQGAVLILTTKNNHCWTKDKCFINGTCYEHEQHQKTNVCETCDINNNYFAWSPKQCTPANNCQKASCDTLKGCISEIDKEKENKNCKESLCSNNEQTNFTCKDGLCTEQKMSCSNYICADTKICATTCTNDSQCTNNTYCFNSQCQAPVPTIEEPKQNQIINTHTPKISGSVDAPNQNVYVYLSTNTTTPICEATVINKKWTCVSAHLPDGTYTIYATYKQSTVRSIEVTFTIKTDSPITPLPVPTIEIPAENETLTKQPSFNGNIDATIGTVAVYNNNDNSYICSSSINIDKTWQCKPTIDWINGTYTVFAIHYNQNDEQSQKSALRTFTLKLPSTPLSYKPIITQPTNGETTNQTPVFKGNVPRETGIIELFNFNTNELICTAPVQSSNNGLWECSPNSPLATGAYTISATHFQNNIPSDPADPISFNVQISTEPINPPVITKPEHQSTTTSSFVTIKGTVSTASNSQDNDTISILQQINGITGSPLCTAVIKNNEWACNDISMEPGTYTIEANYERINLKSKPVTFTVKPATINDYKPEIKYPINNDILPSLSKYTGTFILPYINSFITQDWKLCKVDVYSQTSQNNGSTLVCSQKLFDSSQSKDDNKFVLIWQCTPETPLTLIDTHKFTATLTCNNQNSQTSEPTTIEIWPTEERQYFENLQGGPSCQTNNSKTSSNTIFCLLMSTFALYVLRRKKMPQQ